MTTARMRGVVGAGPGQYQLTSNLSIPSLRPGTVLVHVHAVALNPSDAKKADYSNVEGATTGHDFAGTVVRVSEDVAPRFKEGDRILAVAYGMHTEGLLRGAFSDYVLATADVACKIQEGMGFEEACAMPTALATAGLALFNELRLPLPGTPEALRISGTPVLVSGGASATGTMAVQLLKRQVPDIRTSTFRLDYLLTKHFEGLVSHLSSLAHLRITLYASLLVPAPALTTTSRPAAATSVPTLTISSPTSSIVLQMPPL